jgi:hypothetical protein
LTVNFHDLTSPLLCYFGGRKLDLSLSAPDLPLNLPTLRERALLIARDPVASARFFHHAVQSFRENLLGVRADIAAIPEAERKGVIGDAHCDLSVTEFQGRGTPHLHLLLWLLHGPGPGELFDRLTNPEFALRFFAWLDELICQHLPTPPPNAANETRLTADQRCCQRPLDPSDARFEADVADCLATLVPAVQMHSEKHRPTCFKYGDTCRMGYPREIVEQTSINDKHLLQLARSHPWIVPFHRIISYCCKCNTDERFVLSGRDAVNITRYVTDYVTT